MRLKLSDRVRLKLRQLLPHRQHKHVALAAGMNPKDLSYFLNAAPGRKSPLKLDHLEGLADQLHLSVSQLIGETHVADLSGDEQRVVYAFRALPAQVQQHFMALLEIAVGYGGRMKTDLRVGKGKGIQAATPALGGAPDAPSIPPSPTEAPGGEHPHADHIKGRVAELARERANQKAVEPPPSDDDADREINAVSEARSARPSRSRKPAVRGKPRH